jgi:16S rRNA (guanine527-N7)-methyltransferase
VSDPAERATDCRSAAPILENGARILEIDVSPAQVDMCVEFCSLLLHANEAINLTAFRDPASAMRELLLDALCLDALLRQYVDDAKSSHRVVDVGSGGGVPGIPLAILHPAWHVVLVESIGKKAAFLRTAVAALNLDAVEVLEGRAEMWASRAPWRDAADTCVARAVAPLPSLVELCAPFVREGGLLAFPKGRRASLEVEDAREAAMRLRVTVVAAPDLPETLFPDSSRVVVFYRKVAATPQGYPRRVGLATSRPIGGSTPSVSPGPRDPSD